MVMKMNKTEFINELSNQINYPLEKCVLINDVLENNFFISKKNKDKIIMDLIQKLEVDKEEADCIYNTAAKIIVSQIKNKLKHPFKDQDK